MALWSIVDKNCGILFVDRGLDAFDIVQGGDGAFHGDNSFAFHITGIGITRAV